MHLKHYHISVGFYSFCLQKLKKDESANSKIVGIFRTAYTNKRSLAVMLSRMKKDLSNLDDPPDEKYLTAIALTKKEYNEIRKLNNDVRKKGALDISVISNADEIVLQAMIECNILF